jgi:hypothetical protein
LKSAPEIAPRRLTVEVPPDIDYRDIIQPDEVITWIDVNGNERPMGPTSWANELEAIACVKISNHLSKGIDKSHSHQVHCSKAYHKKLFAENWRLLY